MRTASAGISKSGSLSFARRDTAESPLIFERADAGQLFDGVSQEEGVGVPLLSHARGFPMSGQEPDAVIQGKDPFHEALVQRAGIAAGQIDPADRSGEDKIPAEQRILVAKAGRTRS